MDGRNLGEVKPGGKGKLLKVACQGETRKRLVEMGLTPGTLFEVVRVAPMGDPIDIRVKGYHLSLRMDEAKDIAVEVL